MIGLERGAANLPSPARVAESSQASASRTTLLQLESQFDDHRLQEEQYIIEGATGARFDSWGGAALGAWGRDDSESDMSEVQSWDMLSSPEMWFDASEGSDAFYK